MTRESTIDGTVTIAIHTKTFVPIVDVLPLMILLQDLCGDQTEVFFDFGVISFINVDLTKLRQRFEGGT